MRALPREQTWRGRCGWDCLSSEATEAPMLPPPNIPILMAAYTKEYDLGGMASV